VSHRGVGSSLFPGSASRLSVSPASGSGRKSLISRLLRGFDHVVQRVRNVNHIRRATPYRPLGEGLESKRLLSDVLGWSGGKGGISDSPITPGNISSLTQQYADKVDGYIEAEPLVATVNITVGPNQGIQTVVFVATEGDSLYAFNLTTGQLDWHTNFLNPDVSSFPASVAIFHAQGIWGTPVIDPSTNSIYLVSSESYIAGNVDHYTKTLRELDLSNGTEMPGSPVVIADTGYVGGTAVSFVGPSVRGTGAGSIKGRDYFYVLEEMQRPGLTIDGNNVVIAFGSSFGDQPPMHGWILAYNKTTLQQTGMFCVTPNGQNGGIWMDGDPIQVDSQGYLYTETGNGTFDAKLNFKGFPSRADYGDSVLKVALDPAFKGPNGYGLRVVDYFTPRDEAKLGKYDGDLASSGVLILPDGAGGRKHPSLLIASAKSGDLYIINRNNMGRFHRGFDNIAQQITGGVSSSFDTPGYFDGTIYYAGVADDLKSFAWVNGRLVQTGRGSYAIPYPGASPVISSDGAQNGLVWLLSSSNQLIAFNATDLTSELWSANLPGYNHFSIPDVTDFGYVAVGAGNTLVTFALPSST
jgi:hypothetical protein